MTDVKAKPPVQFGGYDVLRRIWNVYARGGFKELLIALDYKGDTG